MRCWAAVLILGGWIAGLPPVAPAMAGDRLVVREGGEQPRDGDGSGSWLGVWLGDAVDGGVEVVAVIPRGPAQKGGVRVGDVILSVDGSAVTSRKDLSRRLERTRPGEPLDLLLLRSGRTVEAAVEPVRRGARTVLPVPPAPEAVPMPLPPTPIPGYSGLLRAGGAARFGLQVAEITDALRVHYAAPEDEGVLVLRSDPEELAGKAGIRVGDVLVRVEDEPIVGAAQLDAALSRWRPDRALRLTLVRGGRTRVSTLEVGQRSSPRPDSGARGGEEWNLLRRKLELEIERLERRIDELKRELEDLPRSP